MVWLKLVNSVVILPEFKSYFRGKDILNYKILVYYFFTPPDFLLFYLRLYSKFSKNPGGLHHQEIDNNTFNYLITNYTVLIIKQEA